MVSAHHAELTAAQGPTAEAAIFATGASEPWLLGQESPGPGGEPVAFRPLVCRPRTVASHEMGHSLKDAL